MIRFLKVNKGKMLVGSIVNKIIDFFVNRILKFFGI